MLQQVVHFRTCRWSSSSQRSILQQFDIYMHVQTFIQIFGALCKYRRRLYFAQRVCKRWLFTLARDSSIFYLFTTVLCLGVRLSDSFRRLGASRNLPISHHKFSHAKLTNDLVWNLVAQLVSGEKVNIQHVFCLQAFRSMVLVIGGGQLLT